MVVMLLPAVYPDVASVIPSAMHWIFPVLGLILAALFHFISLQYVKRLNSTSEVFIRLMKMLPRQYQRIDFKKEYKPFSLVSFTAIVLFCLLLVMNLIMHLAKLANRG